MAPTVALAYMDPGNGAYMVQAIFAPVGAALFYLRHPIRALKEVMAFVLELRQARIRIGRVEPKIN